MVLQCWVLACIPCKRTGDVAPSCAFPERTSCCFLACCSPLRHTNIPVTCHGQVRWIMTFEGGSLELPDATDWCKVQCTVQLVDVAPAAAVHRGMNRLLRRTHTLRRKSCCHGVDLQLSLAKTKSTGCTVDSLTLDTPKIDVTVSRVH